MQPTNASPTAARVASSFIQFCPQNNGSVQREYMQNKILFWAFTGIFYRLELGQCPLEYVEQFQRKFAG